MNNQSLVKITKLFEAALRVLRQHDLRDSKITERYAEYWVACQLSSRGYKVQVLGERDVTSADIHLPEQEIRVEVKSAVLGEDGFAYASFGVGKQIRSKKFDYCVFLTFAENDDVQPKDIFIFNREELREIAIPRRRLAAHPDSNPCLLMYGRSIKAYRRQVKKWRIRAFEIEKRLHQKPRQFRNVWKKIRKPSESYC